MGMVKVIDDYRNRSKSVSIVTLYLPYPPNLTLNGPFYGNSLICEIEP